MGLHRLSNILRMKAGLCVLNIFFWVLQPPAQLFERPQSKLFPIRCNDTINACPNLREVELEWIHELEEALLDWIQRKTQLANLRLDFDSQHDIPGHSSDDHLDPTMAGFVEHFRNSQNLVSLSFKNIPVFQRHLVKDLLRGDVDKFVIATEKYTDGRAYLKLSKNSCVWWPGRLLFAILHLWELKENRNKIIFRY